MSTHETQTKIFWNDITPANQLMVVVVDHPSDKYFVRFTRRDHYESWSFAISKNPFPERNVLKRGLTRIASDHEAASRVEDYLASQHQYANQVI